MLFLYKSTKIPAKLAIFSGNVFSYNDFLYKCKDYKDRQCKKQKLQTLLLAYSVTSEIQKQFINMIKLKINNNL